MDELTIESSLSLQRIIMYPSFMAKMFLFPILQMIWPRAYMVNYPLMVERLASLMLVAGLIVMIVQAKRLGRVVSNYILFIFIHLIVIIIWLIAGVAHFIQGIPRILLLDYFCFIPLISFVLWGIISKITFGRKSRGFIAMIILIVAASSINMKASLHPPEAGVRREAMQAGMLLKSLWGREIVGSKDKALMEWITRGDNDMLFEADIFQLFIPDNIRYDREKKICRNEEGRNVFVTKDNPSIFDSSVYSLQNMLKEDNIRVVVANSEEAKEKIGQIMEHAVAFGDYDVYAFAQDKDLLTIIKDMAGQLPVPWLGRESPPDDY